MDGQRPEFDTTRPHGGGTKYVLDRVRLVWRVLVAAIRGFVTDDALTQGAAIAFFTGMSLAPLLILLIWSSSLLGPDVQRQLIELVGDLTGAQGAQVAGIVMENAKANVDVAHFAGWFGLGALLFSATGVFVQLQSALNSIWHVTPDPDTAGIRVWLRKRLLSLGMVLSIGFVLLVSMLITFALSALTQTLAGAWGGIEVAWVISDIVVPFLVYLAMFAAMFRYLPDAELKWRQVWFGALVTACLFLPGKWCIGLYLGTSALGSAYGAAGSFLLMLVWTYYSASIVLFGAELTKAYVRERGERVPPETHAVRTHPVAAGSMTP